MKIRKERQPARVIHKVFPTVISLKGLFSMMVSCLRPTNSYDAYAVATSFPRESQPLCDNIHTEFASRISGSLIN